MNTLKEVVLQAMQIAGVKVWEPIIEAGSFNTITKQQFEQAVGIYNKGLVLAEMEHTRFPIESQNTIHVYHAMWIMACLWTLPTLDGINALYIDARGNHYSAHELTESVIELIMLTTLIDPARHQQLQALLDSVRI